jgi:hypothetical protein
MLISALAQLLARRQRSRAAAAPQQPFPTAAVTVAARSLALQRAWLLRLIMAPIGCVDSMESVELYSAAGF